MATLAEISRYILLTLTNVLSLYAVLCLVLKKKRSARSMLMYMMGKMIVVNIFLNQICGEYIASSPVSLSFYMIITLLTGILNYWMIFYTFSGSLAKILLVSLICEIVICVTGSSFMIGANLLKGNPDIWGMGGSVSWEDLLVPAGMLLFCTLLYKKGAKRFGAIKNYELKHQKVWGTACCICMIGGNFTMFPLYNQRFVLSAIIFFCVFVLLIICALVLGIRLLQSWHRQVVRMHNYLTKQRELMRLHSEAVRHQIELMEWQQAEIDEQIEKLSEMEDLSEKNRTASEYLEKLKAQYGAIRAGVYSDDHILDSVLYSYAGIFEKCGVTPEFSFGTYRRGGLKEENVTEVLLDLLETALSEIRGADPGKRFLRLQGGTVKNQVVFRMECACGSEKTRSLGSCRASAGMGMLKHRVKKLGGKTKVSRNSAYVLTEVLMDGK